MKFVSFMEMLDLGIPRGTRVVSNSGSVFEKRDTWDWKGVIEVDYWVDCNMYGLLGSQPTNFCRIGVL